MENDASKKLRILVLCTGNSCRSQMAEGFINHLGKGHITAYSAGIETHGVNPKAIEVMSEAGIDISHHRSQNIDEFKGESFDLVLTVCDNAKETCPFFPGTKKMMHHNFTDPAKATGSKEEIMDAFRKTRDEIGIFCEHLVLDLIHK